MVYIFDGKYGPIPEYNGKVSLKRYAEEYIKDYTNITELPEENKEYLNEIFTKGKYKVTDTSLMFFDCRYLYHINVDDWDMSNSKNTALMFANCIRLKNLNPSKWDIKNTVDMSGMFANCNSIKSIDISNWETGNVVYMSNMFSNCYKLDEVIGTIHLDKCKSYINMLNDTISLRSINVRLTCKAESDFIGYSRVTNTTSVNFVY